MKPDDQYVPIPLSSFEELTAGDIDPTAHQIGVLIAHRCYEVKNTANGVATLRLTALGELIGVHPATVQRKVEEQLYPKWLGYEKPKPGQRIGWKFWLTGLIPDHLRSAPPPHQHRTSSANESPPCRAASSAGLTVAGGAIPHRDRDRSSAPAPQDTAAFPTDDTRRDGRRAITEEELRPRLGETPRGDSPDDDSLPAWIASLPGAGQREFLANCQRMVDAREARWLEDDHIGGKRS